MRTSIKFADPGDQQVEITLRGTLDEFERLQEHLSADKPVPTYAVSALLEQIRDAARRLRLRVDASPAEQAEG